MMIFDALERPVAQLSCRCAKPIAQIDQWKKRIVNRRTKERTGRTKGLLRYTHPDGSVCWHRLRELSPSLN